LNTVTEGAVSNLLSNISILFFLGLFLFFQLTVISHLTSLNICPGELEETAAELEMCRQKLAKLRSQKDAAAVAPPTGGAGPLGVKSEGVGRNSSSDKVSREARELEAALEETKVQLVLLLQFQFMPLRFKYQ